MILTIAFPDTYVTSTNTFYDRFFKLIGINKSDKYKAGHAALVLIDPTTGKLEYYDFGRYITPLGYGRIRSSETDPEIFFPFTAKINNHGKLENEKDIFLFLANSTFTHGDGKMIISVLKKVNYQKAKKFIIKEQNKDLIKYGPFVLNGSNCSRFVADVIIKGTNSFRIRFKTKYPISFTPSPLGNTWNASEDNNVWEVSNNQIQLYTNNRLTIWKDILANFLDKTQINNSSKTGTLQEPNPSQKIPKEAQWLNGIGAGAWFVIQEFENKDLNYLIERYDGNENKDMSYIFTTTNKINLEEVYEFTYPCNAQKCTIIQHNKKYILNRII